MSREKKTNREINECARCFFKFILPKNKNPSSLKTIHEITKKRGFLFSTLLAE